MMTVLDAIDDPNLFRQFFGNDLSTWQNWRAFLCCLYGLPVPRERRDVVRESTHRRCSQMPRGGFTTALGLIGRRSGKSRIAAVVGGYEGAIASATRRLAKGEKGVVAVCAPTRSQSRICKDYLRALFDTDMLRNEVAAETQAGFDLINNVRIEILAGDWRTVRGYTLLAAIVDELAFFGLEADYKVKSDTELIRAIKPALATCGGRLIAITSPYARRGWAYNTHKKHFGNDASNVLVWNCASRVMNPTLPQEVVDAAVAEDLQAAKSEYLGEFRDDVAEYVSRAIVEALVVRGRAELLPRPEVSYTAFADLSGGRGDDAALAIAHRKDRVVVVDLLKRYRPPLDPYAVVQQMCEEVRRYGLRRVTGDNYAAEFVARAFTASGVHYKRSEKPKAALYAELLPRLCSKQIELPDNETLVHQLSTLERRTRSGGRDVIDHPQGQHDDLANVCAGVAEACFRKLIVGGFGH